MQSSVNEVATAKILEHLVNYDYHNTALEFETDDTRLPVRAVVVQLTMCGSPNIVRLPAERYSIPK